MKFVISKDVLEKVVSYLAQKPFSEVANIMKALGTLKQVKEVDSKEEE